MISKVGGNIFDVTLQAKDFHNNYRKKMFLVHVFP